MRKKAIGLLVVSLILLLSALRLPTVFAQSSSDPEQAGSIGLTGTIPAEPPKVGASITVPSNNQTFTSVPITVSGVCPENLLVKLFKNNVFSGSVVCKNGSYSLQTDLFSGKNELIARVFDDLDQPGPDSNTVTVTYNDTRSNQAGARVSITSNYAKRGANPSETLGWPLSITGGKGPYAVSIEWGDGKSDLFTRSAPGEFTAEHIYDVSGVYNVIVKVTDADGVAAFLQVVSIVNGIPGTDASGNAVPGSAPGTTSGNSDSSSLTSKVKVKLVIWPFFVLVPFIIGTFWLGRRHELFMLRKKLSAGDRPFKY